MDNLPEEKLETSSPLTSIIIPAFNEEANIDRCIDELAGTLFKAGHKFEILIVNDGSTDNTLRRAKALQQVHPGIRVLELKRNFGKAVALREGIRQARGDFVAFFDADLQYDPEDLIRLVDHVDGYADIVNGKRDYHAYGLTRTIFSRLYNRILQTVFRVNVSDSNCGLKVLTKKAASTQDLFSYGLPLIIPLLKIWGFQITELPVALRERKNGASKYFEDGSFLGGWNNIRDISYHSIMLLSLVAKLPKEFRRIK